MAKSHKQCVFPGEYQCLLLLWKLEKHLWKMNDVSRARASSTTMSELRAARPRIDIDHKSYWIDEYKRIGIFQPPRQEGGPPIRREALNICYNPILSETRN